MLTFIQLRAQTPDSRYYHQLAGFPFVLVSDDDVTIPPEITDSLFDAVSGGPWAQNPDRRYAYIKCSHMHAKACTTN